MALIDQDIEITLARFSRFLTRMEKWNFVVDIFKALFFRERGMQKLGIKKLDLKKVPGREIIKKLLKYAKKHYPNFFSSL